MKQLTNAQEAIQQAQDSGWQYEEGSPEEVVYKWKVFCDPLFWQALGKARGWEKHEWYFNSFVDGKEHSEGWKLNSLRWFEARMSGGNETTFWQSLP